MMSLTSLFLTASACQPSGPSAPAACESASAQSLQNDSETRLSKGTDVTAVIKDECAAPGPISASIQRYPGRTKAGIRSYEWRLDREMTRAELTQLASSDPCVEFISESLAAELPNEDQEFFGDSKGLPNDPKLELEHHLKTLGASEAYDIFFDPAHGITKPVTIAVIDTGVRIGHEDLRDRIWVNSREIPRNGIDDDANGYVDDVYGYNFASRTPSPEPQKSTANASWKWAHGTRVAGLAAATSNNSKGIAGVAPNARIMALNSMGKAAGFNQSHIANAIRYAVDNGAQVINLSLGGNAGQSSDYKNAIRYAIKQGAVIFAAAGNESRPIGSSYSAAGLAPQFPGLISVGNYQAANYTKSPTSNYGPAYVKLGAPGTYTRSTLLITTSPETNTSYRYFSGTSAAAPVAAGAAALAIGLIESRGYRATPAQIEWLLLESARKVKALASYFKDGNALHLGNLAKVVDERYPVRGSGKEPAPPTPEPTPEPVPQPTPEPTPTPEQKTDTPPEKESESPVPAARPPSPNEHEANCKAY